MTLQSTREFIIVVKLILKYDVDGGDADDEGRLGGKLEFKWADG